MAAASDSSQTSNKTVNTEHQNPVAAEFSKPKKSIVRQDPINLLPPELKPKKSVIKISKKLNKVAMFSVVVALIIVSVITLSVFVLRNRAGSAERTAEELSIQVRSLEQSEQRLLLVRDRLNKAEKILESDKNAYDSFLTFEKVISELPEGISVSTVELDSKSAEIGVLLNNSTDLSRYLANIISDQEFKTVELESLKYLQASGRLELILSISKI